ncbi:MAG TPA: translocation/assembly module TamB domain-containing protein [Vicinamibacterales bacterium]|nr:translocation/assembly module TamB domain-containing protein [Vicinamibacterales bacterium]
MADEPLDPPPDNEVPAEPVPAPRPKRRRKHPLLRLLGVVVALVAAVIVTSMTIDLGPHLKGIAEQQGSKFFDRPMHIGKLSIVLRNGSFKVEDLVIEGLSPTDRPFLKAKTVFMNLPWWTYFTHQLIVENVDMDGWEMLVEQFPGRHSFPKLGGPKKPKTGPSRWPFTTTVRSVIARNGQFTYDDHTTPWLVVCRNLNVSVFKGFDTYRGTAQFTNGSVKILQYDAFRADMQTRFKIDGGRITLDDINLQSEGASTRVTGYVDIPNWPTMVYNLKSRIDFPFQKSLYFRDMKFDVTGHGDFLGTFRFFKTPTGTGRELKGTFTSPEAGVNAWRFPNVHGSLLWSNTAFRVTDVTTDLYGGRAAFDYSMEPLGIRGTPIQAAWDAKYSDVDLARLSDFVEMQGIRLAGRASGRNRLEWPLGKWAQKHGEGEITATMPAGAQPMTRELRPDAIATVDPLPREEGPFNSHLPVGHVPIAGQIKYSLDPDWITIARGWTATEKTYVEFKGRTAWAQRSEIPFHVTSLDWLESDRVLAGIMTAFGAPTGAIDIGGRGEFDGVLYESFSRPRIEGRFVGDRMRAWDTIWGHGVADLVIQNSYVDIKKSVIERDGSRIDAEGRFSLGYPRKDGGEEINANVRITRRPLADLRHAFVLDDYPVDGLTSGEFHVYGQYLGPHGVGTLRIDDGKAYGEPFPVATANLRFEGAGVRLDKIEIRKGTGTVTGAAWVAWDGNYSFDANGTKVPVESLATLSIPRAPLSGVLGFDATGTGTFDAPRYDVTARVDDLFAGDEGIGQLVGHLALRGQMLSLDFEAQSKRLSVSGAGRLARTPEMDADFTFRFNDTSLDPYLRFFAPKMSPYTTAVADGTIRVVGELADIDHLVVEASVDKLQLKLFDYPASNDGPIQLALNQHAVEVKRFRLVGESTALELGGSVNLHDSRIALDASGDANLAILQIFSRTIRSSGSASLHATVSGPLDQPVFSGDASISNGRLRYAALPHSLQDVNGRFLFDAQGVRIVDAVAQLGGGPVRFGGRIGLSGYGIGDVDLTANGEQMHLRYPEDFRSTIDAALTLRGNSSALVLGGNVTIQDGVYTKRFEPNVDVFALAAGGAALPVAVSETATLPVRFDLKIQAPGTLRLENNLARMVSRADLTLNGTYDNPVLFGRADIDHGEIFFEGNRYRITRGTIDFLNPARLQPFFDIEAETRIHVLADPKSSTASGAETYRVTVAVSGTLDGRMNFEVNSDPPLPAVDIISLMFGQTSAADLANPELRHLRPDAATQSEEQLLKAGLLRVLTGGLTGSVSRAVEQSLGFDTVQITPSLGTSSTDPLTPTMRLIIGKRLSSRAYLTYSQALGASTRGGDQVIILEYDQSDRVGYVFTQNGDRTFAIDFRLRRTF